jgi:hypothetical protein
MSEQLSAEHRKQIDAATVRAMVDHGIGVQYHKRKLGSIKGGEKLTDWVTSRAAVDVAEGKGVTIEGTGLAAREAGILLARGLNLRHIDTYVVPLTNLVRWIERPAQGGERWQRIQDAPGLVITGFIEFVKGDKESPLTHWQTAEIQNYLTDRIGHGKAVMPVIEVSFRSAPGWYSTPFAELITQQNALFPL